VSPTHCTMHTFVRVKLMYYTPLGKSQRSRHPDVHESNFTFSWRRCNIGLIMTNAGSDPATNYFVVHHEARNLGREPPWLKRWLGGPRPAHILTTLDTFSPRTMKLSELAKLISTVSNLTRYHNWCNTGIIQEWGPRSECVGIWCLYNLNIGKLKYVSVERRAESREWSLESG
jgi:hypothetical protein